MTLQIKALSLESKYNLARVSSIVYNALIPAKFFSRGLDFRSKKDN